MAEVSTVGAEFRVGRVMARSFSTMFRNIVPFGLIALVLTSPTYVFFMLIGTGNFVGYDGYDVDDYIAAGGASSIVFYSIVNILLHHLVETLFGYLVAVALVFGTLQDLRKIRVSVGECFSQGLARMIPGLAVAILAGIVTLVALLPVMLGWPDLRVIPVLVIPGLYVAVLLWVAIPVAVIERRGIGSLARSAELTAGYRWRVFFVLLVMLVVLIGLYFFFNAARALALSVGGGSIGYLTMAWISSAVTYMFVAVTYAVSYHDLRVAKEGVDEDRIAAVFD